MFKKNTATMLRDIGEQIAARPNARRKAGVAIESDLHDDILTYCRERGWVAVHSRMDKPSTTAKGVADFIIFADRGRTFAIECKSRSGKRTVDQIGFMMQLNKLGHACYLVKSMDEFRKIVEP